jgi:hypothetical protein
MLWEGLHFANVRLNVPHLSGAVVLPLVNYAAESATVIGRMVRKCDVSIALQQHNNSKY